MMQKIDAVSDLKEYFYVQIRHAIEHQRIETSPEAEFYLVQLLTRFAKSEALYRHENVEEAALYKLLARAMESDYESRIFLLRRLGDIALYFAGYFPESLARKPIDTDYYIQMGGTAYASLASLMNRNREQELYQELASRFGLLVNVLGQVSALHHGHTEQDLLRLYQNWQDTGSQYCRTILEHRGIIPHPGSSAAH